MHARAWLLYIYVAIAYAIRLDMHLLVYYTNITCGPLRDRLISRTVLIVALILLPIVYQASYAVVRSCH